MKSEEQQHSWCTPQSVAGTPPSSLRLDNGTYGSPSSHGAFGAMYWFLSEATQCQELPLSIDPPSQGRLPRFLLLLGKSLDSFASTLGAEALLNRFPKLQLDKASDCSVLGELVVCLACAAVKQGGRTLCDSGERYTVEVKEAGLWQCDPCILSRAQG